MDLWNLKECLINEPLPLQVSNELKIVNKKEFRFFEVDSIGAHFWSSNNICYLEIWHKGLTS